MKIIWKHLVGPIISINLPNFTSIYILSFPAPILTQPIWNMIYYFFFRSRAISFAAIWFFCPSLVKKDCIRKRVCKGKGGCGKNFPSVAALKSHTRIHKEEDKEKEDNEEEDEKEEEREIVQKESPADAPIFKNIFDIFKMNPFEEDC